MNHIDNLNRRRWETLVALAGPCDCVPIALALAEGMTLADAQARCRFYHPEGGGYPSRVLGWVRGRPLTQVTELPIKGYAVWSDHVAPILNGRILNARPNPGCPKYYV